MRRTPVRLGRGGGGGGGGGGGMTLDYFNDFPKSEGGRNVFLVPTALLLGNVKSFKVKTSHDNIAHTHTVSVV